MLEVGMFTGTSSLSMAEALPSDGKVGAYKSGFCMCAVYHIQCFCTKRGILRVSAAPSFALLPIECKIISSDSYIEPMLHF